MRIIVYAQWIFLFCKLRQLDPALKFKVIKQWNPYDTNLVLTVQQSALVFLIEMLVNLNRDSFAQLFATY